MTREQICEHLWPETSIDKSKRNLRVYLTYLKQQLETEKTDTPFLIVDNEYVSLKGNIECDLKDLIEVVDQAEREPNEEKRWLYVKNYLRSHQILKIYC